jgi:DNA-binding IclR family transcriptional regulator
MHRKMLDTSNGGHAMTRPRVDQRHLAARLFGILDAFTAERPRLSLSDISRRTGLPVATVHRLIAQLVSWGALDRGDDGRYGIGIRLWEVATLEHRTLGLRESARPLLLRLQQDTGSTVLLTVLDDDETVVVEQVSGGPSAGSRIGLRSPARSTTAGRVLLAHLGAVPDPTDRRVLEGVRRTGIAVCDGLGGRETFSVAVPVCGSDDGVIAALSVVGRAPERDPRGVVRAVRTTAEALSTLLRAAQPAPLAS